MSLSLLALVVCCCLLLLRATSVDASPCVTNPSALTTVNLVPQSSGGPFLTMLYRTINTDQLELTLLTNVAGWVAVGFSETGHMLG